MATTKIWCSNFIANTSNQKPISHPDDVSQEELRFRVKLQRAWARGELIQPESFPAPLSLVKPLDAGASFPDFFTIYDGWCLISEKAAAVLSSFDLGRSQLIETPIFEQDQITQRPERFFLLNVAEHKQGFDREKSTNWSLRPSWPSDRPGRELWKPIVDTKGLAVREGAAQGVDLWFDEDVLDILFFSDRLAKAIKAAKLKKHGLQPCIVVED
ncbi:MAG: DUF1629 domain-containing protein [Pseudomonadota bacterium]